MCHALIIDDNMIVSHAIQSCLEPLGFTSFDHTWTEEQAIVAADRRVPDLIIIGDDVETGCAINAARRINGDRTVPVLMVTGDRYRATQPRGRAAPIEGPFLLDQIGAAVELTRGAQGTGSPQERTISHTP